MNPARAFVDGVLGALAMSLLMICFRAVGVPIHLELQLAAIIGIHTWIAGLILYLIIGGIVALVYALVFEFVLNQAGVGAGLLVGACHTIAAGFIWSQFAGPGRFWDNLGPAGVAVLFILHLVYGAIVGGLYRTEHRLAYP